MRNFVKEQGPKRLTVHSDKGKRTKAQGNRSKFEFWFEVRVLVGGGEDGECLGGWVGGAPPSSSVHCQPPSQTEELKSASRGVEEITCNLQKVRPPKRLSLDIR